MGKYFEFELLNCSIHISFIVYPPPFKRSSNSPVILKEDPPQIATQIIFTFLGTLDLYIKHTKSRTKSEDMKFEFFQCFGFE